MRTTALLPESETDMDNAEGARRCYPCERDEHAECWNSDGYNRCLCHMRQPSLHRELGHASH